MDNLHRLILTSKPSSEDQQRDILFAEDTSGDSSPIYEIKFNWSDTKSLLPVGHQDKGRMDSIVSWFVHTIRDRGQGAAVHVSSRDMETIRTHAELKE